MSHKIGLALGSGGPRGLAHVGIIKELEKNNIPIDYITGSSIGALIGCMYAATKDIRYVEKKIKELSYKEFVSAFIDINIKSGMVRGKRAYTFLGKFLGNIEYKDLKIPFSCVSTDLLTGKAIVINGGDVVAAIRASGSTTAIFEPYIYEDKMLIDGGLSMPVPVRIVRDMGADKVIAVNLDDIFPIAKTNIKLFSAWDYSISLLRYRLAEENCRTADIVLAPKAIKNITWARFVRGQEDIIKIGAVTANEQMLQIKNIVK